MEQTERKIHSITVAEVGKVFAINQEKRAHKQPHETTWVDIYEPIEVFEKNGEMAPVQWYRKGKREFNGKYVIEVKYF